MLKKPYAIASIYHTKCLMAPKAFENLVPRKLISYSMMICCANFVPVKVRISYNFDLVLSQGHVCLRFIPLEAWAERGKYLTKLNTAVENLWRTK